MLTKALIIAGTALALSAGTIAATPPADARSHVHFGFGFGPAPYYGYGYSPYYQPAPPIYASCRYWSRRHHRWVDNCGNPYPAPIAPYPYGYPAPFFGFGW